MIAELGDKFHVCFLDEKWFYPSLHRKKLKILPKAPDFETGTEAHVNIPKVRSRRQSLKLTVMAIVGLPCLEKRFGGKVYNERVSKKVKTSRKSCNQNISDYYEVNHALKREEWK